ncbi:MAG: LamG domain-containing protein [Solirubrobacteraceae bacterium]
MEVEPQMQSRDSTMVGRVGRIVAAALLTATVLAVGAAPAAADPALVGQWRFDEGAGQTAQDDGPLGLHGVLGSSALADGEDPARILGALGGALHFDDSSYVHVADERRLDLPVLKVEAVARAGRSPGAYRYLVAHGALRCFAGSYGLYTARDGGLAFYVFDGERYYVSASARPADVWDGAWHRVTGTFDGHTVRAFVGGREVGAGLVTPAGTAVEYQSLPKGTYFGSYVGSCRLPFTGDLDSVRMWSDADPPSPAAGEAGTAPIVEHAGPTTSAPLAPAAAGRVIETQPPKASCAVHASRKQIRTRRRSIVTVRAVGARRPLRRVRLSVRHVGAGKVLATRRTNATGSARLVLKVRRSGRLRIGVVGRPSCAPAFIRVSARG